MRISTAQGFERGLAQMLDRQANLARVRDQIATGRRIQSAADDPAGTARLLDLEQAIARHAQFQENADVAASRLEQSDSALRTVSESLQRIRELALQGRNGSLGASDRAFLAAEVRERLEQLVQIANTRDANGEFLFAGNMTGTQPFGTDGAGQVQYAGDQGTRLAQIGVNRRVADRDPGDAVFMAVRNGNGTFLSAPAATNVGTGVVQPGSVTNAAAWQPHDFRIVFATATTFDVIDDTTATTVLAAQPFTAGSSIAFNGAEVQIAGAPAAGDVFTVTPSVNQSVFTTARRLAETLGQAIASPAAGAGFDYGINRALGDLDLAMEHLLQVQTSIGTRLKGIDTQKQVNDDLEYQYSVVRSKIQDVDITAAAVELNIGLTALQAAQQAFARTQGLSLFDYL